jgi:hypothetical protein
VCHRLLGDTRLFAVLLRIDVDLAEKVRGEGCGRCGGVLHRADYPRKPRGGPAGLSDDETLRFSFCCAREGCRSRKKPPSVRFLGRRVYLGMAVLLALAFEGPLSIRRIARLRERLGVDERTLRRWRVWWRELLVRGPFWKEVRAGFVPPLEPSRLPMSLLECFTAPDERTRVAQVLRFLSPLSVTGAC